MRWGNVLGGLLVGLLLLIVSSTERRPLDRPSDRFGVAGAPSSAELLSRMGTRWYYDYTPDTGGSPPGFVKVGVVRGGERNRTEPEQLAQQVPADRPSYWLIFNEPDLEEQDRVSDAFLAGRGEERFHYYARLFHDYRQAIKGRNAQARVVGPNLFNLGDGFRDWLDRFRAAHRELYGTEPDFDVWALHIYYLNWDSVPMVSVDYAQRHVAEFIAYVRDVPGAAGRPIWVSEFGTLWGWRQPPACVRPDCECRRWGDDGRCVEQFTVPAGATFAGPELVQYLTAAIELFRQHGIERWFVFTSLPAVDSPFVVPPGCANGQHLLTAAGDLTLLGHHYRALSLGLALPRLDPDPASPSDCSIPVEKGLHLAGFVVD